MMRDWESLLDESLTSPTSAEETASGLRPLLRVAQALRDLAPREPLSTEAAAAARFRFLAQAAALGSARRPGWWWRPWLGRQLVTVASVALMMAILGGGAVWASASSLPGDPLYQIKRFVEELSLWLTVDTQSKAELRLEFNDERVKEIRLLLDLRREAEVDFRGVVESIEPEAWMIGGIRVSVDAQTEFEGDPRPGQLVHIHALVRGDGTLLAREIELEPPRGEIEFEGPIESFSPAQWIVGGRTVVVNAQTEIDGQPAVGRWAKVHAALQADGSLVAREIDVLAEPPATEVRFEGTLENFTAQAWVVSGRTVQVQASTEIRGTPRVGARVEVRAVQHPDGGLVAIRLKVEELERQEVKWKGVIQSMEDGRWVIGGRTVHVTASTEIRGTLRLGAEAEVRARLQPDGTLVATRIEIEKQPEDKGEDDDDDGDDEDSDDSSGSGSAHGHS